MSRDLSTNLLKKYDIPAPRYTSYPTVPYWTKTPTSQEWIASLKKTFSFRSQNRPIPWSLYVHIPFCETLCTFCGCNTSITKNHGVEKEYIDNLLTEWDLYKKNIPEFSSEPLLHFHYGGGTPTFLSPENLRKLTQGLLETAHVDFHKFEGSIEVDPRRTSFAHLKSVFDLGFKRISLGVQDFNEKVQILVNRIQPFSVVKRVTEEARKIGYESVNFDLIYGLPQQDIHAMRNTIDKTIELKPDRIALYSLAFVPWIKPQQRRFKESDLPASFEKRKLYELSRKKLLEAGYIEIGMDHFALPKDKLSQAQKTMTLHRNFMGYTPFRTQILLGLGVSAISESPSCFHQNEKVLLLYKKKILSKEIPTFRGHLLNEEDMKQREKVLNLTTKWEVELEDQKEENEIRSSLQNMMEDGLVDIQKRKLYILDKGRAFLRNVCMAFDKKIQTQKTSKTKVFSKSI